MKFLSALVFLLSGLLCARSLADPIRLQCTPSLAAFAKDLVRPLREQGIELRLLEEAGNNQVVSSLMAGDIDAALLTRPMKIDERMGNPALHFVETTLGTYVVAVVVSRPVWQSGVHALSREQITGLYENRTRNWKEVGGEDRPMIFFDPAHERGPWEIFASWLYGDIHRAPAVTWQVVADGRDMRNTLEFASGAISVGSLRWADRRDVFPLALVDDAGKAIEPSKANILNGTYPLTRPLIIVFPREPAVEKKKFFEFLLSEKGQQIVEAHDFVSQTKLQAP